ncbi:unnamed protein product [Parnassius mnemosyne]|uniref:Protein kinase domain-containing protein n=1 Tax=Parnassius mnemosyne TaxID=213953 RepID=A0AAV1LSV3_9NEOP
MYRDVELRKLPAGTLCDVINTLETNNDWKTVMTFIPKNPKSNNFEPKYNEEHVRLIEEYARLCNRQCAEILLDEWGTSGRIRPTLSTLKEIVLKANILKAADQIAALLEEDRPRRPSNGPGADIDTGITILLNNEQIEQRFNDYDPTKRIQNEFSNEKNLYNVSTLPLKSENDKVFSSRNIPDISFLQSLNNKPTIPVIPSESRNLSEPSLNIPNLSLILRHVNKNSVQNVSTGSQSDVESTQDSVESVHKQAKAENNSHFQKSLPNITDLHSHIDKIILEDTNLINFEYGELENITCKFSETIVKGPFGPSGKIGSGGFGEVFVGYHPKYGIPLAVKKIHSHLLWPTHKPQMAIDMFNTEVKNLTQFRHKNIVPILGFSMNGPVPCIICEYIEGGSLEQQLAAKVLNERQRINIMLGTAEGLKYLHKSEQPTQSISVESDTQNVRKNNFVHRDVKSANILLTKECVPKICDFGLVKQYESTFVTTSPMGTSAYMAPEGFNGTITQKIDIYSYGIVLLELLTGLKPIVVNNNSDTINIKDYVKEHIKEKGEIDSVLDPVVSKWTKAEEIYKLSESCLQLERTSRPSIENICEVLNNINNS